jgi:hypothetical protein
MTLLDLGHADFRRFLTVLVDRRLLDSQCCLSTGLVANGIHLTKRCNVLSSRSDVARGLSDLVKSFTLLVGVFSHQSADYSIVVANLTSNSFQDIPAVCMPIICHLCASDIRLRTMLTDNEYIF